MRKPKTTHDSEYYFDEAAAMRPVHFIERYCRHLTGDLAGTLIEMMDWQKDAVCTIFGTKKKKDGYRRYRNVYLEVPKKNAKSILLSGLGLYMTCADGEMGAEVIAVAGDKDQARIIFDAAREMVESDPRLSQIFEVYKNVIVHKKSKSRFRVVSSDVKTKHGPNVSCLLFDELHVQDNRLLWDTLTKGVANRKQPLVFAITTAGFKNTFAHQMHLTCKAIMEGRVQSKFWYVKIWGTSEERAMKEYDQEALWKEVNPGYGTTVNREYFESQVEEVAQNPAALSGFLRLHLNVWTGTEKTWEIVPDWSNGDAPVNLEALKGYQIPQVFTGQDDVPVKKFKGPTGYMGIDYAPVKDTTAIVCIFPDDEGETVDVMCDTFIPSATLDLRKKQENDQWDVWAQTGFVTVMPGNITDQDTIFERVKEICSTHNIAMIGCDTYNAYNLLAILQQEGLPAVAYPQTMPGMSPPMKELERMMSAGLVRHGAHPILAWQAGNVVIIEDTKLNRMPNKKTSKSRIDGIAALITAFGCWMKCKAEPEERFTASDLIDFIENKPAEK